jgi:hypothetical protein
MGNGNRFRESENRLPSPGDGFLLGLRFAATQPTALSSTNPIAAGAALGGVFDTVGQLTNPNNGEYRLGQTAANMLMGATLFRYSGQSLALDSFLNGTYNYTTTTLTNLTYGRNDDAKWNAILGAFFGAIGNRLGNYAGQAVSNVNDLKVSTILQNNINTGVSTVVGGVPTIFPRYMPASPFQEK